MWGVQGYDSLQMVEKVTKFTDRVLDPNDTIYILDKAIEIALNGRPGPCWIDIPMNIQSSFVEEKPLQLIELPNLGIQDTEQLESSVQEVIQQLNKSKRPLFWLGNGIRLADAQNLVQGLIEDFSIPTLVSWAGIDLVDSNHPLVYGRAGTYGQRCANFILQNCDF
jgi:acetolactate synthase I/II/III large subunit